jgi:hypothetical protein
VRRVSKTRQMSDGLHPKMVSFRMTRFVAGLFVVAVVPACDDSGSSVEVITAQVITVSPPTATVAIGSTLQLSATVLDARGTVLNGRAILWSTENVQVLSVSSSGQVTASGGGTAEVYATADGVTGYSTVTVPPQSVATTIVARTATQQSAATGSPVPILPSVLVTDQFGSPAGGVAVNFAINAGGGSVAAGSTTTNTLGIATVGGWTTGLAAANNVLIAIASGLSPILFTATTGGIWTAKTSMTTPRYGLGVGVINGLIYAVGGYHDAPNGSLEAYDPATDRWSVRPAMPTARYGLGVDVVNGILYAVGGAVGIGTVEAYNPATNAWTSRANMPTQRQELAVGVVNGILYAVGGLNFTTTTNVVEAYNPATNSWATQAPMPTPRQQLGVGVINGILYAVGGHSTLGGDLGTVEAYDPATNSWTTKASMPTRRAGVAVSVINGILYAIGGSAGGASVVEAYHPLTDTWTTEAAMPTGRRYLAAATVNGALHAIGGYLAGAVGNSGASVVEAHRP